MFKVATMCWGDRARQKMECTNGDLDAVLENIHLLINDMEDNFKNCSSQQRLITTTADENQVTSSATTSVPRPQSPRATMLATAPLPRQQQRRKHNFDKVPAHRTSSAPLNVSHSNINDLRVAALTNHQRRRQLSSPLLNKTTSFDEPTIQKNICPRLSPNDVDKFDCSILCPDGEIFKAGVYKSWTAFQLAWKIAHVKGMSEKLALVIEENITDLYLVRSIEDHEIVNNIIDNWAPGSKNTLTMVERLDKYDLFNEPTVYLPLEMFEPTSLPEQTERKRRSMLLRSIMTSEVTPELRHMVLVKDFDKKVWNRKFLRLKDACLYLSDTDTDQNMTKIFDTRTSNLYYGLPEFTRAHKSPTPYCFCVLPEVVTDWSEIKCFCAESDMMLIGWCSGFRIAKYGLQLYMNFREAMNKEANLRRTNSARQSILFRRPTPSGEHSDTLDNKAALDFSGANGRVISDPLELLRVQNEIAFEIPSKPSKPMRQDASFAPAVVRKSLLDTKAWYHGKINREQSQARLRNQGLKEGMFLVRESSSFVGNLVLTVVMKNKKISHNQIFQNISHNGIALYGIENGPQFSTLEGLIESYQHRHPDGFDVVLRKPCPT